MSRNDRRLASLERKFVKWLNNGGREELVKGAARARRTSEEFAKATKPKWWTLHWPMGGHQEQPK